MDILRFKELGDTESVVTNEIIVCVRSDALLHVSNFKAIAQLVIEILHFEDLGNT